MKKIISLLLATIMLLSLCACAPADGGDSDTVNDTTAGNSAEGQLLVGYGKADITPTDSVPLQGYGTTEQRMSTGILSYLYMIAVAITDAEGNTAVMLSADACSVGTGDANNIRNEVAEACKIPAEQVIISAIHQHSAPDMNNTKAPSGITYKESIFVPGAVEAAKQALENRAPATVQTNTVKTENLNFIRHYVLDDGSYAGSNFGDQSALGTARVVKHASEIDNTMQLVKFVRKGQTTLDGKDAKDIILINYQGHPLRGVDRENTFYSAHSDVPGVLRDTLEAELDCQSIYFSGASGNVALNSAIPEENITSDYKEQGKALAKVVIKAEDSYTDIELTAVKATNVAVNAEHYCIDDADLVVKATEAWNLYAETGSEELVKKYGFQSKYEANAVMKAGNRSPGGKDITIFALSFGDLAIVAAPYEMFCATGMNIKAGSPFKMTLVSTIANGGEGYFPTEFAWDYGCYEQYSSNFVRGTAEKLEAGFIDMLKDLHSQY